LRRRSSISWIAPFAKRVQSYNNGLLPNNGRGDRDPARGFLDQYTTQIIVNLNTGTEDEAESIDDDDFDVTTDDQPFIGVASQSRSKSVIAYYGIERHSNWVFTPLFRGNGTIMTGGGRRGDKDLRDPSVR